MYYSEKEILNLNYRYFKSFIEKKGSVLQLRVLGGVSILFAFFTIYIWLVAFTHLPKYQTETSVVVILQWIMVVNALQNLLTYLPYSKYLIIKYQRVTAIWLLVSYFSVIILLLTIGYVFAMAVQSSNYGFNNLSRAELSLAYIYISIFLTTLSILYYTFKLRRTLINGYTEKQIKENIDFRKKQTFDNFFGRYLITKGIIAIGLMFSYNAQAIFIIAGIVYFITYTSKNFTELCYAAYLRNTDHRYTEDYIEKPTSIETIISLKKNLTNFSTYNWIAASLMIISLMISLVSPSDSNSQNEIIAFLYLGGVFWFIFIAPLYWVIKKIVNYIINKRREK